MTNPEALRPEPVASRDEIRGERIRRHAAAIRDLEAGLFDLLAEARRPLVRAQMRHSRRSRTVALLV